MPYGSKSSLREIPAFRTFQKPYDSFFYYFFCEKPGKDDIGIKKHFDLDRCQSPSQQEKKWKKDISKRVVHLTERRVKVGASDERWPIDDIVRTIGARIEKFAGIEKFAVKVDQKKVCPDFKDSVERCIKSYRELEKPQPPINPAGQTTPGDRPPPVTKVKAISPPRRDE